MAICTAVGEQLNPLSISDGAGGAIIAWLDQRSGGLRDVYAQRLTNGGTASWAPDGVPICAAAGDQFDFAIASDGAGGAIIAWADARSGALSTDIYAQRVNGAGVVQWAVDGVAICTLAGAQAGCQIVSDGSGGAIIAWTDGDVHAQRVNAAGALQWASAGVPLCTAADSQDFLQMISDGSGGGIVVWRDFRNGAGNLDVYAQRVDGSGVVQWTTDGVAVCAAIDQQPYPQIASDGAGGAIIVWADYRSSALGEIYAQRVNAAGVVQWTADGVAICTAPDGRWDPQIVSDGSGGAILVWEDHRGGTQSDVYAQRVSAAGVALWATDGVPVCQAVGFQGSPRVASDGLGGAIVVWEDLRNGTESDLYAQRVDGAGMLDWGDNRGVAVSTRAGDQQSCWIISDGSMGAIVVWHDALNGATEHDLYAQAIGPDGLP